MSIVYLTLKSGKKAAFEKFGEIKFGNAIDRVEQLKKEDIRKIENMYRKAAADIHKRLIELKRKGKNQTATDALRQLQLTDLKNSIENNLREITQVNQNMIMNGMQQASQTVTIDMTKWLNSIGINVKESFANVPQTVISNIVSGELYGKDWKFSKRIWGDYNKSVSDITQIVANGITNGKNTFEIAKDLEKYVDPKAVKPWDWGKVYPGSKKVVDYNAQRLARTMINHAYQQSVVQVSKDNPFIEGIEWRSAFTHTTCEICEALNGEIFSPKDIPLDHPNGKCSFIPVINKSSKEIADDLYNWYKGEADEQFNDKMDRFAKQAGFTKADIDLNKIIKTKSEEEAAKGFKNNIENIKNQITNNFSKNAYNKFEEDFNSKPEEIKNHISKYQQNLYIKPEKSGKYYYAQKLIEIRKKDFLYKHEEVNRLSRNTMSTFYHELGHHIDNELNRISQNDDFGKRFYKCLSNDYKNLKNNISYKTFKEMCNDGRSCGVQDICSGLRLDYGANDVKVKYMDGILMWSHSEKYWNTLGEENRWKRINSEAFANMNSSYCINEANELNYMKTAFPSAYELFIKEIVNKK